MVGTRTGVARRGGRGWWVGGRGGGGGGEAKVVGMQVFTIGFSWIFFKINVSVATDGLN